jgi:hypothetical protein
MAQKPEPKPLMHQSGVNKAGEPFVQLLMSKDGKETFIGQMSPDDCRQHALAILEAAEAAEQDAFLMWFVREKLGGDLAMAGGIMQEFRMWREKQTGVETGMKMMPPGHTKGEA